MVIEEAQTLTGSMHTASSATIWIITKLLASQTQHMRIQTKLREVDGCSCCFMFYTTRFFWWCVGEEERWWVGCEEKKA